MSDIQGKIGVSSVISGLKSLLSAISGQEGKISAIQGLSGKVNISGQMSPYVLLSGSGAWTIPLNGKLVDGAKSGGKGVALFHYLRGSSGDIKGSDTFLGSNDTGKA